MFANERHGVSSGGSSARAQLNSNYHNVNKWTSSRSKDVIESKQSGGWLDSLKGNVTSKATTNRSRHSSNTATTSSNAASGGGGTGLAGAWMGINEHTLTDSMTGMIGKGSRVTDALVSPTRSRLGVVNKSKYGQTNPTISN